MLKWSVSTFEELREQNYHLSSYTKDLYNIAKSVLRNTANLSIEEKREYLGKNHSGLEERLLKSLHTDIDFLQLYCWFESILTERKALERKFDILNNWDKHY